MEQDFDEQLEYQDGENDIEFDKTDILAFIIATFQVVMPIVLLIVGAFAAVLLLMQLFWLRT